MKLKLTDKIRKFFGQAEHEDVDDGDLGAYGGSLEASVANLAAIKPSAARREVFQQHAMPLQAQQRPGCSPAGLDQPYMGVAAAEKQAAPHVQLQQQHGSQLPSCTNSQKDAKEFAGGLRTTGQDESYTLQNEVYFPQLLLTLQGGTPEQKAVAAEALFNYTAESDAARQRATQAGVVAHLVDLLRSGTEHGKMYAAYTLSSLTTIDESLEQMHNHGAIPALIDILSTCPLLVCKKGAMRALGRLARSDDAAQEIVAVGGLGPIISLLSRPDSSLVRRCLIALYFIGADKDALQQAIGAAGALPQLLLLARSDSPDVQAEATDVLKVLCRNSSCGRTLAELNGVEVLVATAHAGLTSRAKAAAARALQRLQDIPELKEALAASTARELQLEPSMSPAHSSQLNSSSAAPAAAIMAAAAAGSPHAGPPMQSPHGASAAAAVMPPSPTQTAHAVQAASAVSAAGPAGGASTGVVPGVGLALGESGPEDLKQLAQVLASGNSRWLREKAAAAVEQLATDNPVACRDLAGLGILPALLDMLDAANSSSTRRAAARVLGQLSDDAVMLVHMADAGVVANLLLAAPQLAGSAQRGVLHVLHSLASVPNAITTCFQRQQTVHSMMQILDNATAGTAAAAAEATQRSTMSGGSSGGTQGGADAGVSSRALEVLLSVCRADEAALREIKEYPGGFKLLVSQLQHGPRSTASLILQLLSTLAQHKQHQEDLLKCGVVPTLLTMYRSDDSTVALQAARIMEALSEPASSILQRSLSGNARLADSSSSGSSCGNTPTAAAGAQQQQMPSPLGQCGQQQQMAPSNEHQGASVSSDSSSDYGACADGSAEGCVEPSRAQQQGADMLPLKAQHKAGNRPLVSPSHRVVPSVESSATSGRPSGSNHLQILGDDLSTSQTAAAAAAAVQPGQATPTASVAPSFGASVAQQVTAADSSQPSPSPGKSSPSAVPSVSISVGASSSNPSSASPQRNSISPPRRVAAVAAALEAAAMASASADGQSTPTPGRARQQSGIPGLSRAGSKTPTGLGQVPLVVKRPGSGGKAEQGSETSAQQQQHLQQQQQTVQQAEQSEQPGPSTAAQPVQQPQQHGAALHPGPKPVQQQQQQQLQQHRMQHQIPSRLPRRLPQTPAGSSSPGNNASSSGSRTTTPDPMKRRQHTPSVAAAAVAAGAGASSRSPSASAVHLRVLAAQKQSQRNMASAAGAAVPAESTSDGTAAAAGAAAGASNSGQQQQPIEAAGATGRVMQMAAAIAANAEAAARSASPVRIARQPSQPQAQLQQQVAQPPAQQQQQHELAQQAGPANATPVAAAEAAAAAAVAAGDNCGAGGTTQAAANGSSPAAAAPQVEAKAADCSTPAAPTAAPAPAASAPAAVGAPANGAAARSPSPGKASPVKEEAAGPSNAVAVPAVPPAADADDLLSSTYDNLHGLLLKKGDIEICRTAEGRKCRLGEGGFGVVYKAVMNGVDEVAVKLVKAETPSRKELELFLKEVQTLAKLHHRNIVQFYGACLEMGSMFFVTELMKGGDLYSALRHHSETMKWERLGRKVALDVALGLNYLHAQRPPMMHRDLKSPNVLLSEEGVAKIADVGMVRSQVKDLVTAQPVMTPLWAAPEVVRHERASIKADIWSYGILIWELITGEDITEYQPLSISRQVGPSPNAKAMALPARCPAVARKLFVACTQMDPERRPGAQQLVEWLRADIAASRG